VPTAATIETDVAEDPDTHWAGIHFDPQDRVVAFVAIDGFA